MGWDDLGCFRLLDVRYRYVARQSARSAFSGFTQSARSAFSRLCLGETHPCRFLMLEHEI
jgi:hypothetical protein